jgi:hypothetical protein
MNRLCNRFFRRAVTCVLLCLIPGLLITAALGADASYEGYLGDTITLHGPSYVSKEVYLFMTGPGLPENGVTLTDTTQRADRGQFTMVDVDSNQQWSMTWKTSRIENQIDPGTYTVYVVTDPVDKSQIAGHSYQTLSVYLKDPGTSQGSVSGGTSYSLNPEKHVETVTSPPTAAPTVATPTPAVTTMPTSPVPVSSATTTPKASLSVIAVIAGIGMVGLFICGMRHR